MVYWAALLAGLGAIAGGIRGGLTGEGVVQGAIEGFNFIGNAMNAAGKLFSGDIVGAGLALTGSNDISYDIDRLGNIGNNASFSGRDTGYIETDPTEYGRDLLFGIAGLIGGAAIQYKGKQLMSLAMTGLSNLGLYSMINAQTDKIADAVQDIGIDISGGLWSPSTRTVTGTSGDPDRVYYEEIYDYEIIEIDFGQEEEEDEAAMEMA